MHFQGKKNWCVINYVNSGVWTGLKKHKIVYGTTMNGSKNVFHFMYDHNKVCDWRGILSLSYSRDHQNVLSAGYYSCLYHLSKRVISGNRPRHTKMYKFIYCHHFRANTSAPASKWTIKYHKQEDVKIARKLVEIYINAHLITRVERVKSLREKRPC